MEGAYIDLAYLERFCKGDRARMDKYIAIYLNGAPGLFAALGECLNAGNGDGLAVAAHTLRPQVNIMGAQRLLGLLTAIEEQARAEGPAACAAPVNEAIALNALVMDELRAWLSPP